MKLTMDSYRDYLFIVRLLTASLHEPSDLRQIVNSIDTSTLVLKTSIKEISMEFTLSEIAELKKSSGDLIKLAEEKSNNSLFIIKSRGVRSCFLHLMQNERPDPAAFSDLLIKEYS